MKTTPAVPLVGALALAILGIAPNVHAAEAPVSHSRAESVTAAQLGRASFADEPADVRKPKLDIREVRVVNRADRLRVRVFLPRRR